MKQEYAAISSYDLDAEVQKRVTEVLKDKKGEYAVVEKKLKKAREEYERAVSQASTANMAAQAAIKILRENDEALKRFKNGEIETAEQIRAAKDCVEALGKFMADIIQFDYPIQHIAVPQYKKLLRFLEQTAQATIALIEGEDDNEIKQIN